MEGCTLGREGFNGDNRNVKAPHQTWGGEQDLGGRGYRAVSRKQKYLS